MMKNQSDKKYTELLVECPHCNNKSKMEIMALVQKHADEVENYEYWRKWHLFLCPNCVNPVLYQETYNSEWDEYDEDENGSSTSTPVIAREFLYPSTVNFNYTPRQIQDRYREASRLISIDAESALVKTRRLLEAVCNDQNAIGSTLDKKIQWLANQNIIPQELSDIAHELRHMGNLGAHEDEEANENVSADDAHLTLSLAEKIVEYIYEAPAMLQILKARVRELRGQS